LKKSADDVRNSVTGQPKFQKNSAPNKLKLFSNIV
jgi:hypothetical protein